MVLNFVAGGASASGFRSPRAVQAFSGRPSVFWHNGVEYINLGGQEDPATGNIYVNASHTGRYILRDISGNSFSFSMEPKKIFTPNGSGPNATETMKFRYTNTTGEQVSGEVYDLSGAFMARMAPRSAQGDYLEWDGKNDSGELVRKGVYIYQLKVGGRVFSGTVIVAR